MSTSPPEHAPPLPRPAVFDQRWEDLALLHWAVDPGTVAPYLPAGTRPDVWAPTGVTYVGLVPFRMTHAGPGRHLPVPWAGWFLETNIRLYSVDDAGRHGVVFRSLDASRLPVVALARFGIRIPYFWASMRSRTDGPVHRWTSRRRWPGPPATTEIALRVGARVDATDLEHFLTRRWGMHSAVGTRTMWTPNRHDAWVLHEATMETLDDGLGAAAGFPLTTAPTLRPLWSPGVHTLFGRPSLLPATAP